MKISTSMPSGRIVIGMDVSVNALLRTAALLLLLVTTSVLAERVQYRWIDENGAVMFTDAPPNGVVYQVFRDGIGREIVEPETNEAPPETEQKKDEPVPLYTEAGTAGHQRPPVDAEIPQRTRNH